MENVNPTEETVPGQGSEEAAQAPAAPVEAPAEAQPEAEAPAPEAA